MSMVALSCSSSCSSTVRAALRTALAVQQRRHAYSWSMRITSTTPAAATTATRGGEAASAARGAASAVAGCCSTTPQLRSMATTTNRIGDLSPSSSSSSSKSPATTTLPNAFPVENQPQKEHELHQQQQQQEPSDICMQSPSPSPSLQISPSSRRNLWSEMTRADLDQMPDSSIHILQDLVQQLEDDWPSSILNTREDVKLVVRPLLDACLRMMKQYPAVAADLAERILFTCLARLPPSVADRYPNIITTNHHHATPPPPLSSDKSNNDNTCITTSSSSSSSTSRPTSYPYPDADMYVEVMMICGNLRTPAAAERVHRLFRLMMSEYRTEVQYLTANILSSSSSSSTTRIAVQAPAPRMQTFKCLLRAYAVSGTLQGAMHAHEILNVMEDLSGLSSQFVSSRADDGAAGGGSLDFLGGGTSSSSNAISGTTTKLIEGVSLRLEPPDYTCYTPVLTAYAKCSNQDHHHQPQILKRARILWERMLCRQEQWLKHTPSKNNVDYFQLDWFSYYPMLRIYHDHVLALLQEPKNTPSPQPLRPSFSIMDDNNKNNAILVEHDTLLQEIQNLVVAIAQTTTIPATVPRCYRVLSRQFDDGEKHCNQSSKIRTKLEEHHPITWAYQVLVQALLLPRQPGNYAHDKKSENELLELERIRIQQAHVLVLALAGQRVDGLDSKLFPVYRNDDVEGEDIVWPTQDIILDVILAWERLATASNKAGPGGDHVATSATAAAAVLPERVQQLVKVAVNAPYKSLPDFHQAIFYWQRKSHWKNAPFVNQAILERLLREYQRANYSEVGILIPTSQTFAMVMWSWMESKSPRAPHKIEWLFDQLILLYGRTHSDRHLPDGTHVHLLLSSWIRHCPSGARFDGQSGTQLLAAQHVTRLLQSLDMSTKGACEHHAWKNQLLNERHFGIAFEAWACQRIHKDDNGENDCHPDQAHEAFTLWKHLVDSTNSIPPLSYCNKVLVACVKASVDAQKIDLSSNCGDNYEKEKKRREGHYKAAMHVYRYMRDHEVKNKDKKDNQRLKRDSLSYELILQAWKQAHIVLPNQIVDDDPIQFVLELMEDCCTEGLLTQTLCFEMVEFLLLFANDDNLAKMTLRRLFGVSESAAVAILQAAPVNLVREPKTSKLLWQGTNKPTEILLENLNSTWTLSWYGVWQERKNDY